MSDEPKCRVCGKYNGTKDSADWCRCPKVRDMDVSEDTVTPPTPDPRERGEAIDYGHLAHCNASRSAPIGPNRSCVCWNLMQDGIAYRATHPAPAPSEAVAWMVEFKRPDESDWQKSGPHFSYAEAEQDQTRLLLRHWPAHIVPLYTHPAPARGVTEALADLRELADRLVNEITRSL